MMKLKWERAQRMLSGLSAARKLALGAIVALMIVSIVWLSQQSAALRGHGRMEPVLDQAFADADVVLIGDHLRGKNIPHELRDGRVYVPGDRKMDVLSELIYANVVTGSTESGFDAMIRKGSVFDTPSKTDKMFNHAREVTLAQVIGSFRGVRKATVLIDPTNERHIGGAITPSALVDIQTRAGGEAMPRQLASAAINAVTGAVSTMDRTKVKVTIDGASYNVAGAENFEGDVMERRQQCEQAYVAKVRQMLSYIPDVLISVSVDLNLQSMEEEKRIVDPEKYLHLETKVETRVEENPADVAPDRGVLANAVPQIPEKPEPSSQMPGSRNENSTSEYSLLTSETVQKSKTPAGKETVLSASVAVPRSYFVQVYKRAARESAKEPDDALLQPIVDAQLTKVRKLVRNALGLKNDADVTVEVYEDASAAPLPAAPASVVSAQTTVLPTVSQLKAHTREISYAAAGIVGLVALSMMFRRGGSGAAGAGFVESESMPVRPARVRVAAAPLARDVEEDSGETDDLLRQVRELAARQPADATRVLREWIYQD